MADERQETDAPSASCMWCSAPLPSPDVERCPTCGAALTGELGDPLPGITAVDATAILRGSPTTVRPRNRILSWISGDYPEEGRTPTESKALEPPDLAVKREMLRLELEGEVANLKAEADALVAEAAAEGRTVELPDVSALSDEGLAAAEAVLLSDIDAADTDPPAADAAAPDLPAAAMPGVTDALDAPTEDTISA